LIKSIYTLIWRSRKEYSCRSSISCRYKSKSSRLSEAYWRRIERKRFVSSDKNRQVQSQWPTFSKNWIVFLHIIF